MQLKKCIFIFAIVGFQFEICLYNTNIVNIYETDNKLKIYILRKKTSCLYFNNGIFCFVYKNFTRRDIYKCIYGVRIESTICYTKTSGLATTSNVSSNKIIFQLFSCHFNVLSKAYLNLLQTCSRIKWYQFYSEMIHVIRLDSNLRTLTSIKTAYLSRFYG